MEKKMTNRQIAALETKKKIIEAARKIISEKGFENVSVDEIMAEAGLGKGTFYSHFSKKEDIIQELNKTDFYRLAEIVNEMTEKDIIDKLEYYCTEFMKAIERSGVEICRQWIRNNLTGDPMCLDSKELVSKYQYDVKAMKSVLNAAIEQGQLTNDTPVEKLALFINSQLYGLMIAWCMSQEAVTGSKEIKKYRALILEQSISPYINK